MLAATDGSASSNTARIRSCGVQYCANWIASSLVINASEIADFVYCERSWWLGKHNYFGQLPRDVLVAGFEVGNEYHRAYTSSVQAVSSQRRSIRRLVIVVALLLAVAAVVFMLLGQAHGSPKHKAHSPAPTSNRPASNPPANNASHNLPLVAPAPWIFICIVPILIFFIFRLRQAVRRQKRRWHMPPGNLVFVDDQNAPVLTCHELGLAGKPDAVWRDGSCYVPEERKTTALASGRGPFDNHVLQLIAYCYLVAKHYGPVQKGVISYANIQRSVVYTRAQDERLVRTLNRMRMLEGASAVHRSHQTAAKCHGCVAASMCREALR